MQNTQIEQNAQSKLMLNGEFIGFSDFGESFSSKLKFEFISHRRKYTLDYNFSKILSHTLI